MVKGWRKDRGSARIQLTKGYSAVVDAEDLPWLTSWKWYASVTPDGAIYAARREDGFADGKSRLIYMHRQIVVPGPDSEVDHENGDTLDNRKRNLRPATRQQNIANTALRSNNTSGFRGVYLHAQTGKWCAQFRRRSLGLFGTPEEAAAAYEQAAAEAHGDFALSGARRRRA